MADEAGPTGRMVEQFLARLCELDLAQWADVVRAWRDTLRRTDVWAAAEDAVGDAIARTGRHDAQWQLQERLYELFRASPWHTIPRANATPGTEAAAQYLASSAAFALLMGDAIGSEALRTLYAPFAGVIPLAALALPRTHGLGPGGSAGRLPAA
jgi:hypothetical protein